MLRCILSKYHDTFEYPNLSKTRQLPLSYKLTGKEAEIKMLLDKRVSKSAIARILGVHRLTVADFVKEMGTNHHDNIRTS
jgi:DNA invertase Pin-like site-specific DNA recombinase